MPELEIRNSPFGKGVFTQVPIKDGTRLIKWEGRTLIRDITAEQRKDVAYITHIGHDEVTVKSNAIDDYVNHSCDPNCGLKFEDDGIFLYAITDIPAESELLWDYSTTVTTRGLEMFPEWKEPCACRASNCRGIIGTFQSLSEDTKARYIKLGIVPNFVLQAEGG